MPLKTPVAFLIFNRPDLTQQVFDRIAEVKPKKLLVVADGPRFSQEEGICIQTRKIIQNVNWDCEVITNFSEINLGCKNRVSSGLDWVFSEVEEAIILEDDCLPTESFFYFCQTLLERYRDDERVMHISGNNFQSSQSRTDCSYFFSKYTHIWGWASWCRAWKFYDVNMKTWLEYKNSNLFQAIFDDPYEEKYWINIFDLVFNNCIDTWDYQWTYACWLQNGLSILPNQNLISNLGFNREDAVHTVGDSPLSRLATSDIWEMIHPEFMIRNREADIYTFNYVFGGQAMRDADKLPAKLHHYLNSMKQKMKNMLSS